MPKGSAASACKLVVQLGSLPLLDLTIPEGTTRLGRARDNDIVLSLPEVAESKSATVGGIRSPVSSTRTIRKWPGCAARATSGA